MKKEDMKGSKKENHIEILIKVQERMIKNINLRKKGMNISKKKIKNLIGNTKNLKKEDKIEEILMEENKICLTIAKIEELKNMTESEMTLKIEN